MCKQLKMPIAFPKLKKCLDCLNVAEWFHLFRSQIRILANRNGRRLQSFDHFHYQTFRLLWMWKNAFLTNKHSWPLSNVLMQSCLGNVHLQYCIIHLDDIIVFSKTPQEHLVKLWAIFKKLKKAEFKLKPSKCEFCKQELTYLGHVVSKNGIQTDCKKVNAIWKWPVPTNVTEVHSFLGCTNYYHRFIKKYAQVAKPLYKLISGKNRARKQKLIK